MLTSVGSSCDSEQPISERQVAEPGDEDEQDQGVDQDHAEQFSRAVVHTTSCVVKDNEDNLGFVKPNGGHKPS